ncbi:MAG: NHL repeat-containing protein [Bacteroidia bacterium]|nr:NHL repeat-containing protein [Bacteroidia bacterium]
MRLPLLCILLLGLAAGVARAQDLLVEEYRFGDFTSAHAIVMDQFGDVYVSDAGSSMLRKFSIKGALLAEIGGHGWDVTQFDQLRGIDASLGVAVYAADRGNRRIVRLDRNLNVVASLGTEDAALDVGYPIDVAASSFETLFILDGENARVLAVNGFSSVARSFGGIEAGEGRLRNPVALAQAGSERLYVLEAERVVVFDLFGSYRFQFGSGQLRDARGIAVSDDRVAVVLPDALLLYSHEGSLLAKFDTTRLALASAGQEFRDIAFGRDFLLILTERTCILIPVN